MKDQKDINQKRLAKAEAKFKKGYYVHYKGGMYIAFALTLDEGTLEILVHYYSIVHRTRWTRTLTNFLQEVRHEGKHMPRFEFRGKAFKKNMLEAALGR